MSTEVILVDYRAGFDKLVADSKVIQDELRKNEEVGVKGLKKIGEEAEKTEKKTKSLTAQLKSLKEQIATATDPKEATRLAEAAGKIEKQLRGVNKQIDEFTQSKFQNITGSLGEVGQKIAKLDFAGALKSSKQFGEAVKSVTFKESIGGIKNLGSTLLNLGKAMLTSPIFLIGGAIIGIVANFDKLKNAGGVVGKVFSAVGDIIGGVVHVIEEVANYLGLIDTESQKIYEKQTKNLQSLADAQAKTSDRIIKILKSQGKETINLELQKLGKQIAFTQKEYELYRDNLLRQGKTLETLSDEELKTIRDFGDKKADLFAEQQALYNANQQERIKKEKETSKKLIEEAERLAKVLRDLQTGNIKSDYERKRQQILDNFSDETAKYKGQAAILRELEIKKNNELNDLAAEREAKYQKILQEGRDKSIEIFKNAAKEMAAEDVGLSKKFIDNQKRITEEEKKQIEIRKQLQSEFSNFLSSTVQATAEISNNIAQAQLQETQEKSDAETEAIKKQYEQGIISKDEYEKRKAEIDKRTQAEEARIKKKQFETNKQLALIQVAISTAQAIAKTASELGYPAALPFIALAAANAALQIAAIESQPTPKFEKGGKVGGRRHSQGGTIIEAEKDEFVIRRSESIKHDRLLTAINKGQAARFIKEFYIAPALKAQRKKHESAKQESFADSLIKSMSLNPSFNDSGILEGLKMNRKNDREIAHFIVKELKGNQRSSHKW